MNENLRIAILQVDLAWEDPSQNRELFSAKIDGLSQDVDLIVLPEMFSTGFSMNAEVLAEPHQGATFNWMQNIASQKGCAVTGSLIIKENRAYYNRLYFIYPDGSFKYYDKRHTFTLAKEHETYTSGKQRLILEYKGWRICPLICYDLRFPVWARNTEEYDLLIYVANWPETRIHAWNILLQARAIENMAFCIGVNRTGKDGNMYQYNGHSAVYDCLGKALFEDDNPMEFTQMLSLDKSHLNETRGKLRFLEDRDPFILK